MQNIEREARRLYHASNSRFLFPAFNGICLSTLKKKEKCLRLKRNGTEKDKPERSADRGVRTV